MGSWQAAALHALVERGLVFDRVMGFSIGALNGAAYALGALEDAVANWRDTDGGIMRVAFRLRPFSIFSERCILDQIALLRHISPRSEERLKSRLSCPLTVVSVDRVARKPVYAHYTPHGAGGWDAPLSKHLAASCAIPAIFPPIEMEYQGRKTFLVDGGVRVSTPVTMEALAQCKDVIVLETLPGPVFGRRQSWPLGGLGRAGRREAREVVDDAIASLSAFPDPPRVFRLRPQQPHIGGFLDFSARALAHGFERGLEDAALFAAKAAAFVVASRQ